MVQMQQMLSGLRRRSRKGLNGVVALVFAIGLVVFQAGGATAAPRAAVTGAAIGQSGGQGGGGGSLTRVALELSDQVAFNVFTLPDPYRVVIDLPDVEWRTRALADSAGGPCGTVRYGEVRPGTWRIVLECAEPTTIHDAVLTKPGSGGGYRLVVELGQGPRSGVLGYMTKEVHHLDTRRLDSDRPSVRPVAAPQAAMAMPTALTSPAAKATAARSAANRAAATSAAASGPALVSPTAVDEVGAVPASFPMPARRPSASAAPAQRIVVLDAGHGGVDPGAIGVSGIYEKNITLAAVRDIKRELEDTGRYKVFLTRNDDRFIRLRDRVSFARAIAADLFVSIHADSVSRKEVRGASIYTLSKTASDAEAAGLAEKENKADLIAGIDLSHESEEVTSILIDLAQRETMNRSAEFAGHLVAQLHGATGLLANPHRFAGFAVLKAPDIPSVLIELGFLSNRADERTLRDGQNRGRVARAVARAIDRYLTATLEASAW